jgi:exosome complex RNA-binding protein Rrp4
VPDSTTSAIDRVFDLVDSVVDKTDRVLNRTKYTEEQHRARRAKRADVDTAPGVRVVKGAPRSTSTALATRRFQIIEAIAAETGTTIFVVTNGDVRAECTTRALAEKILHGLETAP